MDGQFSGRVERSKFIFISYFSFRPSNLSFFPCLRVFVSLSRFVCRSVTSVSQRSSEFFLSVYLTCIIYFVVSVSVGISVSHTAASILCSLV